MNPWIQAARPKTLPLAASGIILGSALAYLNSGFQLHIFIPGLLTALLLQILSNFANDYGDYVKGTDANAQRFDRSLTSGQIKKTAMKKALIVLSLICLISGMLLLYAAMAKFTVAFIVFIFIGLFSIAAAIKYTVGKSAFGYSGLGDVFVLFFFGLVSVSGIYFLHLGSLNKEVVLAALGCGFLSTGVLNVNNIRDMITDAESGKKTMIVRFGLKFGHIYHRFLIWCGFSAIAGSFLLHIHQTVVKDSITEYFMVAVVFSPIALLLVSHDNRLNNLENQNKEGYNKELKMLSLTTLLLVVIYFLLSYLYVV